MKRRIFAALTAGLLTISMISSCAAQPTNYVNYATALQNALYFYDANMCGTDVGESSAFDWRDDCHTFDTYEYNGQMIDLTGGYHDAGDHVKFGLPAAYTAFTLGYAYHVFPEAFVDTKQDAHLKEITDRFAEYFRKCAIYEDGKVVAFCYQVGTGGGDYDHGYWGSPENQPQVNEVTGYPRVAYFTDDKNINADIVSATIAALAMNYINYGNEEDLKVAIDLHTWLEQYTDMIVSDTSDDTDDIEIVSTVPQYARWESEAYPNSPWDYITLGEYTLNLATGKDDYSTIMQAATEQIPNFWTDIGGFSNFPVGWDGVWPYVGFIMKELGDRGVSVLFSRIKEYNLNLTDRKYADFMKPEVYAFIQEWGGARLNSNLQFTGIVYEKFSERDDTRYQEWAVAQMDYLFGKNDNNQAFMVGYNYRRDIKYPKYPHHRASSSPAYGDTVTGNGKKKQSHILVGALVGGPGDKDGTYEDSAENYTLNEVGLDYNAGFVGALAGLYCSYDNSGTATIVNPPSKIAKGVEDTYAF